jgi:3-oxoacyl-[acyl-carrier-protein] synthase III
LRLIEDGRISGAPDWFVCHYSSAHFRTEVLKRLGELGLEIPEERWFSNLSQFGNTGSASLFLLLDGLLASGRLTPGQRVVAMVPESGRFITCFLAFTVVGPDDTGAVEKPTSPVLADGALPSANPTVPVPTNTPDRDALADELKQRLAVTWIDFAESLGHVPVIARLTSGRTTLADYHALLLNLRQQVVDGSRWISRAASNITAEHFELRSLFTRHAAEEHRDFLMLERDYAATGGDLAHIRSAQKNLGSEAFSAFMFQAASRENPFALTGSMVIIEGLGNHLANDWGAAFCKQLGLTREQCTFMLYHGANDHHHLESLDRALSLLPLTHELVDEIVRTARITARLYRLQLEELGNC